MNTSFQDGDSESIGMGVGFSFNSLSLKTKLYLKIYKSLKDEIDTEHWKTTQLIKTHSDSSKGESFSLNLLRPFK